MKTNLFAHTKIHQAIYNMQESILRRYVINPIVGLFRFIFAILIIIAGIIALVQGAIESAELNSCVRQANYRIHDHDLAVQYCKLEMLRNN